MLLLIWVGRRFTIRPPGLFALYVAYYCFGRFFEELLRDRPGAPLRRPAAERVGPSILFVGSVVFFVWHQRRARGRGVARAEARQPPKKGPTMAIPKGRVR